MITMESVTFIHKGQDSAAINDVSLTINDGEFVGIIGPGGGGKTTFTELINGVAPHCREGDFYGKVVVDGMDTAAVTLTDISRVVGSVFEDIDGQMVSSTVEEELTFALVNFGFDETQIRQRVSRALEDMGISELRYRSLHELSGGQKQKTAIASVMALSPRILALDEPTGELDPGSSVMVYEILKRINRQTGATIIITEKKLDLLYRFADRLIVIERGRVALDKKTRDALKALDALSIPGIKCPPVAELYFKLSGLGLYEGTVPLNLDQAEKMAREAMKRGSRTKGVFTGAGAAEKAAANEGAPRELKLVREDRAQIAIASSAGAADFSVAVAVGAGAAVAPGTGAAGAATTAETADTVEARELLRFENVSFSRANAPVLRDLSFTVRRGERIALIGPNGVGKSTLLKLCNGLYHPTSGRAYLDGKDTASLRTSQIAKTVGFMFQNPDRQLFADTVRAELAFGLKLQGMTDERARIRIEEMLDLFELRADINPLLASRSVRQKVALASLIAPRPHLLLLDEPTTGLDYKDKARVLGILETLNRTEGAAIIVITHDMELVQAFASRALLLLDGRLAADRSATEVLHDEPLLESASLAPPQLFGLLRRLRDVGETRDIDGLVELIRKKVIA